jgi:hypothetical protein
MDAKLEPEFFNRCPIINEDFCSRSRPAKKIIAGIFLIFRGLFFEHNAENVQKDHLRWTPNREQVEPHWRKPLNRSAKMH